jgi:histidine triad (HIT) family protein
MEVKMADDCIFCKIVRGEIPCAKVYEDQNVLAFDDIHPMAPVHVIVIPKKHIPTLLDCTKDRMNDLAAMMSVIQEVAKKKGVDQKGFRTVMNCNAEGGQVIFHLHAHVLGGKKLTDEMG